MEEKYKILIVDDEQSILDMLKLQLEFEGYSVYTAGNAAEALDKLSYSPDIVLLDINMDGMNGLSLILIALSVVVYNKKRGGKLNYDFFLQKHFGFFKDRFTAHIQK